MKFNPMLLAIACLLMISSVNSQGQNHVLKHVSTNKNTPDEHDHRKCGIESATDRLAKNNPEYAREVESFKNNIIPALSKMKLDRSSAPIIYVPVVVHIIHNGETVGTGANLSEDRILAQIDVLNQDFSAMNPNYDDTPAQWQDDIGDAEIQFCMAILDPDGNATNGITRHNLEVTGTDSNNNNIEDEIKPATWWNSNLYYNIYVLGIPGTTSGGGVTGYAYYPTPGMPGSVLDGSVVDYRWFGGPGHGQSGYGTLTHETGHYLGLPHTFDGEDCGDDDNIADTPNVDAPTSDYNPGLNCGSSFPTGPFSCGNEHMYVNFMDYVNDDDCSTSFTNDQITVMRAVLDGVDPPDPFNYGSRLPLANNSATACSFFDDDAGITIINQPGSNVCGDDPITPIVILQNFGTNTLTTVTISYQVNGGTPVDYIWIDNLGTGESQEVTLSPYSPPPGTHTFTVYTHLPNGNTDEEMSNDQQEVEVSTVVPGNLPLFENFEDAQWDPTINGVFQYNVSGDVFTWERSTAASAYGSGSASALFNNYDSNGGDNPGGTIDALISPVYDFSTTEGANLVFDVAYAPYNGNFFDSLEVMVSTDCGSTFNESVFSDGNTGLATAGATTAPFTPTANQWETHTIDLSAFDLSDNLTIAFVNKSGYGNRLFIDNININSGCAMTLEPVALNITCNGLCDGVASVNAIDGTEPLTYQWSANAGNSTESAVANLCAGDYSVTVTDATNCTAETIVTITEPDVISVTANATNETAVNANDGTASAIASGGVGTLTYLWDNGDSGPDITNLEPGIYVLTVFDENDCISTATVEVIEYDCGNYSVEANSLDIACFGQENGSAELTAGNGTEPYSYLWSNGATTAEIVGLEAGDYSYTVTDAAGCLQEGTVTIDQPDEISVSVSSTDETAEGANDGTANATVSGGVDPYNYDWSNGETTAEINNLAPGDYFVTVTDANGCTAEQLVIINPFDCGDITINLDAQNVSCFGFGDGSISASVENGTEPYTYLWSNGEDGATIDNLIPGTYTLMVTDADGCMADAEFTITEPDILSVSVTCTDESTPGANDGSCTVSVMGGTSGYTEQWSNGGIGTTISGLAAGDYCVTVTDANGCTEESCGTVNQVNCTLSINVFTENISCFGMQDGVAEVTIDGGTDPFDINWSTGANTPSIQNLTAGSYSITVTDSDGCEVIEEFNIVQPQELLVTFNSNNPSSNGGSDGSATAIPAGGTPGYNYDWDTGSNEQTIDGLNAGVYVVTVTDLNGCSTVNEVEISDPNTDCSNFEIQIDISEITCNGFENGAIVAVGVGGTNPVEYDWSNGVSGSANSSLGAGTYSVTATDAEGCVAEVEVVLSEPPALTIDMSSTPESSNGAGDGTATADVAGGTPPYQYDWSNGGNTATITGLSAGSYSVTVTDANGCVNVGMVGVIVDGVDCSNFEVNEFDVNPVSCFGGQDGSAIALATGGTNPNTYQWSNGDQGASIFGLTGGVYVVTATDANGCMAVNEIEVPQPGSPVNVDFITTDESSGGAADATIDVSVSGGVPGYTYSWSDGATTEDRENLTAGCYTVTITDSNGCEIITEICIEVADDLCTNFELSSQFENISCNGEEDGLIVTTASGGMMPISYNWSNGESGQSIFNLSPGAYTITVVDGNDCEIVETFTITEFPAIELIVSSTDETFINTEDGTADANAFGGAGDFVYEWSNGATSPSIVDLAPGIYTITVTDANGCTAEESVEVLEFTDICGTYEASIESTNIECPGDNDGTASAQAFGGTPPYIYQWNTGSNGSFLTGLSGGIYTVTISDFNGCIIVLETQVEEPTNLVLEVQGFNGACGSGGTAQATVSGGTPSYVYEWSNGATGSSISNLENGIYEVTITDDNGCSINGETEIENDSGGIDIESEVNSISCFGEEDGSINLTVIEGTAPYIFEWSTGAETEDIENLPAGTYTVLVTDSQNCSYLTTFSIASPAEMVVDIDATSAGTNGNGTATANVFGGTTPYTFLWSTGANSPSIENLTVGTYTVTTTDTNGCTATETVNIGVTAIQEINSLENLLIHPNPSEGNFNLKAEFTSFEEGVVEVYNVIGQRVYSNNFSTQDLNMEIDLTSQAQGAYILILKVDDGLASRKLMITK